MADLAEQLIDTWRINNRVNLFFLDSVPVESLHTKPLKGRTVGAQFGHMHSVRLMWLKAAAPELLEGLEKAADTASVEELKAALEASGAGIEVLLGKGLEAGKIKNFKPHVVGFVGYLIAHEAHHRGQAELVLRELGTPIDDKASYGIWEWGSR